MLTDVGNLHQIRVQTALFRTLTEGGLVHSGRAGTDNQTVQILFSNGGSDSLLTGLTAHIGIIFRMDNTLFLQSHLHDFLHIHRCGNVTAAMTDKYTNSTHFLPPILSEGTDQQLLGCFIIDQRCDLIGTKSFIGTLTDHQLPGSINELAGLHIPGATLHACKAAKALIKGRGFSQCLNIATLDIRHKLMRLDVHFIERGAGRTALAALHALQRINTADFFDSLNCAHTLPSFTPSASASSSVK
jgi:hypothetical protein